MSALAWPLVALVAVWALYSAHRLRVRARQWDDRRELTQRLESLEGRNVGRDEVDMLRRQVVALSDELSKVKTRAEMRGAAR